MSCVSLVYWEFFNWSRFCGGGGVVICRVEHVVGQKVIKREEGMRKLAGGLFFSMLWSTNADQHF